MNKPDLSVREYFAALAMQALASSGLCDPEPYNSSYNAKWNEKNDMHGIEASAKRSVKIADALINELNSHKDKKSL